MGKRRDPQYVRDQLEKQKKVVKDLKDLPKLEEENTTETATEEKVNTKGIGRDMGDEIESAIASLGLPTATVVEEDDTSTGAPKAELPKRAGRPPKSAAEKTEKAPKVLARDTEGHCRVCGKTLTQEKSVTRGVGPVCFAQMRREFSWDAKAAKEQVASLDEDEWTKLVEQVRELLTNPTTELTEVPAGYVEMSKWWREAEKRNLSGSAISRAVGGDRAVKEPLDVEFQAVYVQDGNRTRKYLPGEAMREEAFEKIRASQKPRVLTGAAKAAKEKKEATAT